MNLLEHWIDYNGEDLVEIMNILQFWGLISDNAVMPGDVANQDCIDAVAFLAG